MRQGKGNDSKKMKTTTFPPKLLISVADYSFNCPSAVKKVLCHWYHIQGCRVKTL
jgi:hypothetical protein